MHPQQFEASAEAGQCLPSRGDRFVPLALVLLAPIVVNIVRFHAFMAPSGLPVAVFNAVLWVLAASGVREAFRALLKAQTSTEAHA